MRKLGCLRSERALRKKSLDEQRDDELKSLKAQSGTTIVPD